MYPFGKRTDYEGLANCQSFPMIYFWSTLELFHSDCGSAVTGLVRDMILGKDDLPMNMFVIHLVLEAKPVHMARIPVE